MEKIIKAAVARGATDLHIKAGDVFRARINGELVPLTKQALSPAQTRDIAMRLVANEDDRARLDRITDYDCSWGATGIGRFRVNILRQRSSFMVILRVIPFEVPTIQKLGLPDVVGRLAEAETGLVVVSGQYGSGKSSAIAALLHHANTNTRRHIITLESAIEFLHRDVKCSITQREIGVDTASMRMGLQAALRQDTDVIVMENVDDLETMEYALQSVERGRLMISSMMARDVQSTIDGLLALAPQTGGGLIVSRLAASLNAVVSLRLAPRANGEGRVLVTEVAVMDNALREMISDPARTSGIPEYLASGAGDPSNRTFGMHLAELLADGIVSEEVAGVMAAGVPAPDRSISHRKKGSGNRR